MSRTPDQRRAAQAWRRWAKRELIRTQGARCRRCFKPFSRSLLTLDHIVPLSRGGTNEITNVQLLCDDCHRGKDAPLGRETTP